MNLKPVRADDAWSVTLRKAADFGVGWIHAALIAESRWEVQQVGLEKAPSLRRTAYDCTDYRSDRVCQELLALLGSGFEAVRAPSPAGVLPPPTNPRLTLTDNSGELTLNSIA